MNVEAAALKFPKAPASSNRSSWRPRAAALRVRCVSYLLTLDLLCIALGFMAGALVRDSFLGASQWLLLIPVTLPIYAVTAFNSHAFASQALQDPFAAVVFIAFAFKANENFPRLVLTIGLLFAIGLMTIGRYFFVRHLERIVGGNPFGVVLICDGEQPVPPGRFSVMMAADAYLDPDTHDPMMYDRLAKVLQGADRVVVACTAERRLAWAHALKGAGLQGEIVIPELAALKPLGVGHHGETPTMVVATGALDWFDRTLKRGFDILLAGGAVVMLAPLLLLVAFAVKLDSRGPVLFKQTRIGRGNEMFKVLKFRSMRSDLADGAGHRSAARDDDRVTRIGRLIRSTSIDELPQLLNVLRGT